MLPVLMLHLLLLLLLLSSEERDARWCSALGSAVLSISPAGRTRQRSHATEALIIL